ncbi:L-ribulose-5-phosphate 4-epimerase [Echinimonas agarilytica]|uniref:L-ribulose-5-phosphate 4-epimerase n=2 Tax=Echinimonas agarilytica TaxID=1215918 RepID=A0AA41W3P7_9GAMM|nr:L-ribulose-5-phosphate 4-epimerase [Echinimonas agarilytica]
MLDALREEVLAANLDLPKYGLVTFTWGNVSAINDARDLVVIKPSGVAYENMSASDMVIVDLKGNVVEGTLRPSSDTATHLALYRQYDDVGGVVHTHSSNATSWAQSQRSIPVLGTTHADYFNGTIPCSRLLTPEEVEQGYEELTGSLIIETLGDTPPLTMPGILISNHGPFAWGKDAHGAVHNAVVLEEIARMALATAQLNPGLAQLPDYILNKHYSRKHGKNAYYGQNKA